MFVFNLQSHNMNPAAVFVQQFQQQWTLIFILFLLASLYDQILRVSVCQQEYDEELFYWFSYSSDIIEHL